MKKIDLGDLTRRLDKGRSTVDALSRRDKRWTMSVPARYGDDADLVLTDALQAGKEAISLLAQMQAGLISASDIRKDIDDALEASRAALATLEAANTASVIDASTTEPLDGAGIDTRLGQLLPRAWERLVVETDVAPSDFWVVGGKKLGFRPDMLVARAGGYVEELIGDEVEKRVARIDPYLPEGWVPGPVGEMQVRVLVERLQATAGLLPPSRRRQRSLVEQTLRELGLTTERPKAALRAA